MRAYHDEGGGGSALRLLLLLGVSSPLARGAEGFSSCCCRAVAIHVASSSRWRVGLEATVAAASSAPSSSPLSSIDAGAWIELAREEATVQEQKRKVVEQLDGYEASLRRLRYDRVDYLVRRQQKLQSKQDERDGRAAAPIGRASGGDGSSSADVAGDSWGQNDAFAATDTVPRSVVKALAWRALAEAVTYAAALHWFRGSNVAAASAASRFVLAASAIKLVAMVGWERAFARRRGMPALPLLRARRLPRQPIQTRRRAAASAMYGEPPVPRDGVLRSLAKALTWRAMAVGVNAGLLLWAAATTATATTTLGASVVSGRGGGIALLIQVVKMEAFKAALLFLYERIWNRIDWGKIPGSAEAEASGGTKST